MTEIKIVGLGGSLSDDSKSLAALNVALAGASEAGAETQLLDIRDLDLPLFAPALVPVSPPNVIRLVEAVSDAQGMIWSSPLYHGTISGSFKNAIDWLELMRDDEPPYLTDKVIGLIAAAGGSHGLQAINTMEFIVRSLRGWAVPLVAPVASAWKAFDENGRPLLPRVEQQLLALGAEVMRAACQFADEGVCDYSEVEEIIN